MALYKISWSWNPPHTLFFIYLNHIYYVLIILCYILKAECISVMLCLTELTLFVPLSAIDTHHASVSIWYLQTNVSASAVASV